MACPIWQTNIANSSRNGNYRWSWPPSWPPSRAGINSSSPPPPFPLFFFSFPALFANWLRSSVVSVLFSLISESFLRKTLLIILIFGNRDRPLCLHTSVAQCHWAHTTPDRREPSFSSTVSACPVAWRRSVFCKFVAASINRHQLSYSCSLPHLWTVFEFGQTRLLEISPMPVAYHGKVNNTNVGVG